MPPKTAVLSVGRLFCPFCFCCGWLMRCAVLAFFPLVFGPSGARARDPSHKTLLFYSCLLHLRFRAGLRAVLAGLLFLGPLARARDLMSAFWVGAGLGPTGAGAGHTYNLTSHIILLCHRDLRGRYENASCILPFCASSSATTSGLPSAKPSTSLRSNHGNQFGRICSRVWFLS